MRKIRCLVVDDEPLAAKLISTYASRTPFLSLVGEASSAEEALDIIANEPVDLLFLDIHMPRLSGMEVAKMLPEGISIVFTTAYSDYALEGFAVNALDYLLKPVSYEEFMRAATRALNQNRSNGISGEENAQKQPNFLTVKSEYRLIRIPTDRILYCEGLKDYVKIYTDDDPNPILTLMSMKGLETSLPEDLFMRVHRSFIVNMDKVRIVERNCIIMGNALIPVSESSRKRFYSYLGLSAPEK